MLGDKPELEVMVREAARSLKVDVSKLYYDKVEAAYLVGRMYFNAVAKRNEARRTVVDADGVLKMWEDAAKEAYKECGLTLFTE